MSPWTRGAAASPTITAAVTAASLLALAGCSSPDSPVEVSAPTLSRADAATCRALVSDVPRSLAGESSRPVTPRDAPAAAWGDPAITLTCGAPLPRELTRFSSCVEANGVGWFVPESEQRDQSADLTWSAVGYRPVVALHVPADYRPEGAAAAIAQLAPAVTSHLRLVKPCH